MADPVRVCFCPGSMEGGGIGTVTAILAEAVAARGAEVALCVIGETAHRPEGVRMIRLPERARAALPVVYAHLRDSRPDLVVSARDYVGLMALLAHRAAPGRATRRLFWGQHTHRSSDLARARGMRRVMGRVTGRFAAAPDGWVAVSEGVAADLVATTGISPERVRTIPNPVWTRRRAAAAARPARHAWLAEPRGARAVPVILGIGRLVEQKDFLTLVRSFARLRATRPARLVLLGEGPERSALEKAAVEGGVADDIALPGHVRDPLAYLGAADLFVLSSRWEGLPTVLIEALGCGCPPVATNCPSGPREILQGGRLGPLVPVGDAAAMAAAMAAALSAPPDHAALVAAADAYTSERAAAAYLDLLA